MKKLLLFGIFAGALTVAVPAHARGFFSLQIGIPLASENIGSAPPVHVPCAPVVVAPPVCVPPAVVIAPPRVVLRPPAILVPPPVVIYRPHHRRVVAVRPLYP